MENEHRHWQLFHAVDDDREDTVLGGIQISVFGSLADSKNFIRRSNPKK